MLNFRSGLRVATAALTLLFALSMLTGSSTAQSGNEKPVATPEISGECLESAGPRSDGKPTDVEVDANRFDFSGVGAIAALCSRALSLEPGNASLKSAREHSLRLLKLMAFGDVVVRTDLETLGKAILVAGAAKKIEASVASYYLGIAFEFGIGSAPSREAALGWYRRAAEAGLESAREEIARLETK